MNSKIDIKHSLSPGVIPTTSSINLYELAFNSYDGKIYYKKKNEYESIEELVSTKHTGSINMSGSLYVETGDLYIHGNKQFNYGMFQNNTSLSGSANVSYSFQLDTIDEASGISVINGSQITFINKGTYNIQFSAQIQQGAGKALIYIWFKKNGINIPDSATAIHVGGNNFDVPSWNFINTVNENDYIEIAWQSNLSDTLFPYVPPNGNIPAIPSIIVTVNQVR